MATSEGESRQAFEAVSRAIAKAVSLCEFSLKERRILTVILEASFGAGRCEAFIPGLTYFERAARVSKGNVSEILRHLKRCLVIEEQPKDCYSFRLPADHWRVPLQIDLDVVKEVLALQYERDDLNGAIRQTLVDNEIARRAAAAPATTLPTRSASSAAVRPTRSDSPRLDAGGESLGVVVSRESVGSERAGGEPVTGSGKGYPSPAHFASPVPETGTKPVGSRNGNAPQNPQPAAVFAAVPESGTAPSLQACSLGTEQGCTKVASLKPNKAVQPCRLAAGAFDVNQQAVLDELEAVGAFGRDNFSKGNWVVKVRETAVEKMEGLLGELRYRQQRTHLKPVANPGAWLNREGQLRGLW